MADKPKSGLLKWLDNISRVQTVQAVLAFFGVVVPPSLTAAATVWAGRLTNVPLMWIILAGVVVFMCTIISMLAATSYSMISSPDGKLRMLGVVTPIDLNRPPVQNRQARRASSAQGALSPAGEVTIAGMQVALQVQNAAQFPLPAYIEFAESSLAGKTPPRTRYPKQPLTIRPGSILIMHDDRIDMGGLPCQPVPGTLEFRIKYGRKGRERFELKVKGNVTSFINPDGLVQNVYFAEESNTA